MPPSLTFPELVAVARRLQAAPLASFTLQERTALTEGLGVVLAEVETLRAQVRTLAGTIGGLRAAIDMYVDIVDGLQETIHRLVMEHETLTGRRDPYA